MDRANNIGPPCPSEFDEFLPWACVQLSIDGGVVVHRSFQQEYVSLIKPKGKVRTKSTASHTTPSTGVTPDDTYASEDSATDTEQGIRIKAIYNSNFQLVQIKFMDNTTIPRKIFKIIELIIPFYKHLTSIVVNKGLRKEAIYDISKILPISRITEICFDNTVLAEANYCELLGQNNLKHLSLARCKINDAVVKTIAARLTFPQPASKTLSILNMGSNRITDLGATYMADVLRTNRQLSYLNLADNMITDNGAIAILNTLADFPLSNEELADVKKQYLTYLKKCIEINTKETKSVEGDKKIKKKSVKKKTSEKDSNDVLQVVFSDSSIDSKLLHFNHPFSSNYIEMRDSETYCLGNNALCYLNLAYNDLTYFSIKRLYEVLLAQKFRARSPKGLVKVVIEGNLLPVTCIEYYEINELISSGLNVRRPSDIRKKISKLF